MIACCSKATSAMLTEISAALAEIAPEAPPEALRKLAYAGSMPMTEPPSNPRLLVLQAFRAALTGTPPPPLATLAELLEQGLLEQALLELKRARPRLQPADPWYALRKTMEAEVAKARERRLHQWPLDPDRRVLRLRMEVRSPACDLHPSALQAALARALLEAGWPLAMGLEKSPRPMVRLGYPLPLGVPGLSEWADATLRERPPFPKEEWADRVHARGPGGLRILQLEEIPHHASPVLELSRRAHWAWTCPEALHPLAMERLRRFEAAETYAIAKIGKVEGQKQVKQIEVRHLVLDMGWEGDTFRFATRLAPGEALSPVKLLAGVLELEASAIQGLARLSVELAEDPRLLAAGKYETKLHNIFEDAVLLESGATIPQEEDEDDDPIVLRGGPPKP